MAESVARLKARVMREVSKVRRPPLLAGVLIEWARHYHAEPLAWLAVQLGPPDQPMPEGDLLRLLMEPLAVDPPRLSAVAQRYGLEPERLMAVMTYALSYSGRDQFRDGQRGPLKASRR